MLHWFDNTESPQLVMWNQALLDEPWTCDERDACWTLNQAQISLQLTSADLTAPVVGVEIDHSMPNLDRLLYKLGEDGAWRT